jgi:predicted RNA-binding Zn ribbon-like protein
MSDDWRDGFLFVGNQLALDFLNTKPQMDGESVELLPDCPALARWLAAACLIAKPQSTRLQRQWTLPERTAAIDEVRKFRETLRDAVLRIEGGLPPSRSFIGELNSLLLKYPRVDQVARRESGLSRQERFDPRAPEDAFGPIADAAADLLISDSESRIRKCSSCVLHFRDISKNGTRHWCSMNLCGNRAKVGAFAKRKRATSSLS